MLKIGIQDIDKLILLADEVLDSLRFACAEFDENGIGVWSDESKTSDELIEMVRDNLKNDELCHIISRILRDRYTLSEAIYVSVDTIVEKVAPLERKIVGMFRHGVEMDTDYCVENTVTDEYLMKLFAMRVRDRMITFAMQRTEGL